MPRSPSDLMLAAILALLSYAPFEYVAKTTLIVAAGLFIIDPIPPYSRLIALLSIGMVALLHRTLQSWQQGQEEEQDENINNEVDQADRADEASSAAVSSPSLSSSPVHLNSPLETSAKPTPPPAVSLPRGWQCVYSRRQNRWYFLERKTNKAFWKLPSSNPEGEVKKAR